MDWKLKRCCTSSRLSPSCNVDRLSSLPDELLCRILSMLSTKDVIATVVLSNRMRKAFSWITSIDLDDSPISHCIKYSHLVERFPLFESFVDNVSMKVSQAKQPLTRFRLGVGGDKNTHFRVLNKRHECQHACFPVVRPARLNVWLSYPLVHCSLKELDISFHVGNPSEFKLPSELFACQSLEILKLDCYLEIGDGAEIPLVCLPNLKLLHLHSFVFTEDDFVTRLVSSCSSLEDLSITYCSWVKSDRVTISSHSLRRLALSINKCEEEKNSDLVLIDAPNLQYLLYDDDLPHRYSVTHMNALVKATIYVIGMLRYDDFETSFRCQLSLVRALSDVQHLSLLGYSAQNYYFAGKLKNQLPVFRNLRTLELGPFCNGKWERWDIVLMLILHCSPSLETLVFPEGLFESYGTYVCGNDPDMKEAALEAEGWRTTQTMPSCFLLHLKRIVFNCCFGFDRELNMIKFLVSKALVLEELVVCLSKESDHHRYDPQNDAPNLDQFETSLQNLPRASHSSSITVER
ncbi:hypothetical protein RND81_04G154600 [Saponaria officinalis]|uniref:F-box domain-containing protein n=1 Tax=Saponaria officinalis TaxID=3572 RepID=A0AAW1LNA3_SAPOF